MARFSKLLLSMHFRGIIACFGGIYVFLLVLFIFPYVLMFSYVYFCVVDVVS